nr:hypothetical protein Iba_chr10dCG4170 [Ipomoea batatas]
MSGVFHGFELLAMEPSIGVTAELAGTLPTGKGLEESYPVVLISILDHVWSIPWIRVASNGTKHWGDSRIGGNTSHRKAEFLLVNLNISKRLLEQSLRVKSNPPSSSFISAVFIALELITMESGLIGVTGELLAGTLPPGKALPPGKIIAGGGET